MPHTTAAVTINESADPAVARAVDEAGGITCQRTMTDPRLTGTLTSPGRTGGGDDPQLYAEWWTFTLANDGSAVATSVLTQVLHPPRRPERPVGAV